MRGKKNWKWVRGLGEWTKRKTGVLRMWYHLVTSIMKGDLVQKRIEDKLLYRRSRTEKEKLIWRINW